MAYTPALHNSLNTHVASYLLFSRKYLTHPGADPGFLKGGVAGVEYGRAP